MVKRAGILADQKFPEHKIALSHHIGAPCDMACARLALQFRVECFKIDVFSI
jgi:hypothetical protein